MTYPFRLQRTDGTPADPATFRSSELNWRQGEIIHLTPERRLRVLGTATTTPTSRRSWSSRTWPNGALARRPDVS